MNSVIDVDSSATLSAIKGIEDSCGLVNCIGIELKAQALDSCPFLEIFYVDMRLKIKTEIRKKKYGPRVNSKAANVLAAAGILRRREGERPRNRPALSERTEIK
jgi:hypothetical protein